jgi:polysaccharide export outer membrane protein
MKTRLVFGRLLRFKRRYRHARLASTLQIAVFLAAIVAFVSVAALAQTAQPSESARTPTISPASSPVINFDLSRSGPAPQTSPGQSIAIAPAISAPNDYQLSTDDQIAVEVFGEEDLRSGARLNADGAVSLPLLGSVRLAGLTLNQAAARLTELYGRDYLVNPKVNVMLIGYAKRRFTMLGQVNRPGSYDMPEGSPSGIDLLEAVAIAGGYTRIAAPERISVKRRDQIMRVDAKKMARQSGTSGNFRVEPGDTITVGESLF